MSDDDDWDAPIALKKPAPSSAPKFDDEDEEQVDLTEGESSLETSKPKKAVDPKQALAKANSLSKQKQREREEELAREAERARSARPMTEAEKLAEQLRLKKLVEEADANLAGDLFGAPASTSTSSGSGNAALLAAKAKDGIFQDVDSLKAVLMRVQLTTTKETDDFAKAVGQRLEMGVSRPLTVSFLKNLLRHSCQGLTDEDVNDVTGVLNVIKNEKVKAKLAKKKPVAAVKPKGNLNYGGDSKFDLDGTVGQRTGLDKFDDDDFM